MKRRMVPESERRRSTRERARVSYAGMDDGTIDKSDSGFTRAANVNYRRVEKKSRAPRAVFQVGGRVYDSELGVTCHWCRQKTVETHVTCVGEACAGARLPVAFCRMCLSNRHGEDIDEAVASGCWMCPRCRGSCGEGCVTCCNCGPCRKKAGLAPTHQIIGLARSHGFDNVHDYLVHQNTGESREEIAARKLEFPWGKWLRDDFCRPVEETTTRDAEDENTRVVNLSGGSSADEKSVRDVSSSELSDSDGESSESDDDRFMIVRRSPVARASRASPAPASAVALPFSSPASTPSGKRRRDTASTVVTSAKPSSPRNKSSPTKKKTPPAKRTKSAPRAVVSPRTPASTPLTDLGDDVYEFERILSRRKRGRGEQLLIKWRGFGEDEATWEPARNILVDAPPRSPRVAS